MQQCSEPVFPKLVKNTHWKEDKCPSSRQDKYTLKFQGTFKTWANLAYFKYFKERWLDGYWIRKRKYVHGCLVLLKKTKQNNCRTQIENVIGSWLTGWTCSMETPLTGIWRGGAEMAKSSCKHAIWLNRLTYKYTSIRHQNVSEESLFIKYFIKTDLVLL